MEEEQDLRSVAGAANVDEQLTRTSPPFTLTVPRYSPTSPMFTPTSPTYTLLKLFSHVVTSPLAASYVSNSSQYNPTSPTAVCSRFDPTNPHSDSQTAMAQNDPTSPSSQKDIDVEINVGCSENYIGPGVRFSLSRSKLCSASLFFRNALKDEIWLEGQTNTVDLPGDDIDAFRVFALWCEGGSFHLFKDPRHDTGFHILTPRSVTKNGWNGKIPSAKKTLVVLVNAFFLSEKLQALDFQQDVARVLQYSAAVDLAECLVSQLSISSDGLQYLSPMDIINTAYDRTSPDSRLRKALAYFFADVGLSAFDALVDETEVSDEFLRDVRRSALDRLAMMAWDIKGKARSAFGINPSGPLATPGCSAS